MEFIGDLERTFANAIYPNRVPIAIGAAVVVVLLAIVARRRRWDRAVRSHPRAAGAIAAVALAIGLPVGWYLSSPLFLSTNVDEPPPVVAGPTAGRGTPPAGGSASSSPQASAPAAMAPRTGHFTGADEFHFGRGTATLLETSSGRYVVRLEDFAVRNGPDLYVYLSPSPDGYADGALELAPLKADTGNQNYDVPGSFDPASARSVVIWCKQFGVLFATAALN